jgi:hypothetical protein
MKIRIAYIQLLPRKNIDENLEIGKKACVEAKERELYSMSEEEREKEWERVITELAKF